MGKKIPLSEMPDWPKFMTRSIAAAYLGVSESTFRQRYENKQIQPIDYNNPRRFNRTAIDELYEKKNQLSEEERAIRLFRERYGNKDKKR